MSFSNLFAPSIAAMRSNSLAFQVIGENIANAVTPGFKAADTRFVDILSASKASKFENLGGVRPTVQNFISNQGVLQRTQRPLDLAINGNGFFVTNTGFDRSGEFQLSRAGQFGVTVKENNEAYITDPSGNYLLGWQADATGAVNASASVNSLAPIRVDPGSAQFDPIATTTATLNGNWKSLPGTPPMPR